VREFVAWAKRDAKFFPYAHAKSDEGKAVTAERDALIAKWDAAGFETPGDRPSTKENDDE